MYRKCVLHGQIEGSRAVQYLPVQFAKVGNLLSIQGSSDLFLVVEIGEETVQEKSECRCMDAAVVYADSITLHPAGWV